MKQFIKKLILLFTAVSALLHVSAVQAQKIDPRLQDDMQAKHYEPGGKYHLFGNVRGIVKNRTYNIHLFNDSAVGPVLPISHERSGFEGTIGYETHFSGHGHEVHNPFDHHESRSQSDFSRSVDGGFTVYTLTRKGSQIHPADGYDGPQGGGFPKPKGARDIYKYYVKGMSTKTKVNVVQQAPLAERWRLENRNALAEFNRRKEEASKLIWESKPNQNLLGNGADLLRGTIQAGVNPFATGFEGVGAGAISDSATKLFGEHYAHKALNRIHLLSFNPSLQLVAATAMQESAFAIRGVSNSTEQGIEQWAIKNPNTAAALKTTKTALETFGAGKFLKWVKLPDVLNKGGSKLPKWTGTLTKAQAKKVSKQIGKGHAFDKHIHEFYGFGIKTRRGLIKHIESTIKNPSDFKQLPRGRSAYWDDKTGTIVIIDPRHTDGGTAFRPTDGKAYFDRQNK